MEQPAKLPQTTSGTNLPSSVGTVVPKRSVPDEPAEEPPSQRYRLRPDEFLLNTSEDERSALRFHVSGLIAQLLDREMPIYLEGLGILFPKNELKQRTRTLREKLLVQQDSVRTVRFEKCSELVPYHWEKFGRIVETREFVHQLYPNVPLSMRTRWSESELRSVLRGYIAFIRREIVRRGFCLELSSIADFFSLHNRQGRNENDWFAGADVFIVPRYEQTLFIEPCVITERPLLESAWELLQAAFGKPRKVLTLDLVTQLTGLGYDPRALDSATELSQRQIPVAVFERGGPQHSLIYCTDGLRALSRPAGDSAETRPGNELVFQLSIAPGHAEVSPSTEIPDWPLRPLTMGWILMQSARSRTIRCGAGLSADVSLIPNSDTELRSIFATSFNCVRHEQLSTDRPFVYINLVGITADEAAVASKYSPEFLLRLLEHRELDQATKPGRSSIVTKTGLLEGQVIARKGSPEASEPLCPNPEQAPLS